MFFAQSQAVKNRLCILIYKYAFFFITCFYFVSDLPDTLFKAIKYIVDETRNSNDLGLNKSGHLVVLCRAREIRIFK